MPDWHWVWAQRPACPCHVTSSLTPNCLPPPHQADSPTGGLACPKATVAAVATVVATTTESATRLASVVLDPAFANEEGLSVASPGLSMSIARITRENVGLHTALGEWMAPQQDRAW